jgi:hypothetical protein
VKALNSLQTNTALIQELKKNDRHSHASNIKKFEETITVLERYVLVRIVYIKNTVIVR